jgi:hypothetical protein
LCFKERCVIRELLVQLMRVQDRLEVKTLSVCACQAAAIDGANDDAVAALNVSITGTAGIAPMRSSAASTVDNISSHTPRRVVDRTGLASVRRLCLLRTDPPRRTTVHRRQ